MKAQSIGVNTNGIKAIKSFASNPNILAGPGMAYRQHYIPGITIPGIKGLDRKAFNLPINGDDYPATLVVDYPSRTNLLRKLTLVTTIPDDDILFGTPNYKNYGITYDRQEQYEESSKAANELFDEHFSDDGFVHIVLEERSNESPRGGVPRLITKVTLAEIVVLDTSNPAEQDSLNGYKDSGFGALDLLNAMKKQFGIQIPGSNAVSGA